VDVGAILTLEGSTVDGGMLSIGCGDVHGHQFVCVGAASQDTTGSNS
jgi:hypothetical protein